MMRVQLRRVIARAVALLIALGVSVAPAAADTPLPPIGGPGGGAFAERCPAGQVLFGLELATGDDVNGVRPVCARALAGDRVTDDAAVGPLHGQPGLTVRLGCPLARPVVLGMYVGFEGDKTVIVNNIHLFCGRVSDTPQPLAAAADAAYDGPPIRPSTGFPVRFTTAGNAAQQCPPGQVAVGVDGRSGVWLDAVALVCGPSPVVTPPPAPPPAAVEPAVCRSLDYQVAHATPANAVTITTLRAACARATPPPAACRSLVNVINANGPAATIATLNALCVRARRERGLP